MGWFWAAYRNGEAKFAPEIFPEGMDQGEFSKTLLAALELVDDALLMEGMHPDKGVVPMGLVTMRIAGRHIEPHFDWFWWASPRNKLECGLRFFTKYGDEPFVIAVPAKSAVDRYCTHLAKYGVMRHIGVSHNWGDGTKVLYESRG